MGYYDIEEDMRGGVAKSIENLVLRKDCHDLDGNRIFKRHMVIRKTKKWHRLACENYLGKTQGIGYFVYFLLSGLLEFKIWAPTQI